MTWVPGDNRYVAPGVSVNVATDGNAKSVEGSDGQKRLDLYAVWAPVETAGLFGYSMSVPGTFLLSSTFGSNGYITVGDQILGNNGLSSGGAQKYSVLGEGWQNAEPHRGPLTITSVEPGDTSDGYKFIAWFNKNPGNVGGTETKPVPSPDHGDFLLTSGNTLEYDGRNGRVYSVDALWGKLTQAVPRVVTYDEKGHHVMFQGNTGDKPVDVPDVVLKAAPPNEENVLYGDDTRNGAPFVIGKILDSGHVSYTAGTESTKNDPDVPTDFTEAGEYTYSATGSLLVPGEYYKGGVVGSASKPISFTGTGATLTILPKLTLNVYKTVTGDGAPDVEYTFNVTKTGGDIVKEQGEAESTTGLTMWEDLPQLTAKDGEYSDTITMWFPTDGEYTFTIDEKEGDSPIDGMTYDITSKTVTVQVENYKIKSVTGGDGVTCEVDSTKSSATATATFTNIYKTGSLKVTKNVVGYVEDGIEFRFTVTLTKDGGTPVSGTFGEPATTFNSDGKTTFNLKDTESKTLTGLPPGVTYTVEEDKEENFEAAIEPSSGTITAEKTAEVIVTNTRKTGSLTVTKIVNHEPGSFHETGFKDGPFIFTVTPKDPTVDLSGVKASVDADFLDSDGVKTEKSSVTFTMKDGDLGTFNSPGKSVTLTGLPAGLEYTVTETTANGYATTYNPSGGTVEVKADSDPAQVTVNNLHYPGALVITKNVVDPYLDRGGTDDTGTDIMDSAFDFTVRLDNIGSETKTIVVYDKNNDVQSDGSGVYQISSSDNEKKIQLKNGWYAVIQSLQVGTKYTVTEDTTAPNFRYKVTPTIAEGTIEAGEGDTGIKLAHAAFVNTFETGDLTIRKNVGGADTLSRRYTVELTLKQGSLSTGWDAIKAMLTQPNLQAELSKFDADVTVTGPVSTSDGGLKFTLSLASGKTYLLEDLPAGLGYAITEIPATGFDPTYEGCSGTIVYNATQAAVITNTFKPGSLKITKNMEGDGNAYRSFSIDVTLGPEGDETVKGLGSVRAVYDGGGARYIPCTNGKITVSLRKNQSVTLSGLPQGASYEVKEQPVEDYSASYSGNASGAIGAEVQEVTVINSYQAGTLQVTKKVIGAEEGEDTGAFNFTVRLSDTSITGTRNGLEFTGGVAAFTLKAGQSISIPGLKAGVEFTVTEDEAEGYETTYAVRNPDGTTVDGSNTGTIVMDKTVTVTVTNTKPGGGPGGGGPGGGGPGGGGGVSPPWDWPTDTPEGTATPGPTATPDPNATPTPGGTPGPGQTSQPFGTPQPTRKPGTTSQPFTPGTGGGTGGSGSGSGGPTAPATGDETAIAPWAILLALSAAGLAAVLMVGRRRRGRG